ncbi:MAG: translocation/assembly module TamB [Tenacibaculum sp.]|nr:translocation/assembly module TamB [Tenacibaculum sp.]
MVQNRLGKFTTNYLNKEYGTNIVVKKIDLSFLGRVNLKNVEIRDHHKDTLIFVGNLKTSLLNVKNIVDNKLDLGDATLNGVKFYMKTHKGEKDSNMSIFLDSFEDKEQDSISTPFILKSSNICIENLTFKLIDENKKDSLQFSATNAGGLIEDFSLVGSDVSMKARELYFIENRGINIKDLTTDFTYTKKQMELLNTTIKTDNNTSIKGNITFNYKIEDFAIFLDKVKIKANFNKSVISVKDLNKFYNELKGNDKIYFRGNVKGVLNDFVANNLNMQSKGGMKFNGDAHFTNSFNYERGFIFKSHIKKLSSNYNQLINTLPNVLGKTIPTEFNKLGDFDLSGNIKVTPKQIDATLDVTSKLGGMISDLRLTNINDIDNAKYKGEVEFVDFDLGRIAQDSILGKVSLKANVYGEGFSVNNINTKLKGKISKVEFKKYTYKNLDVNGNFQNKKFDGILQSNDENFNLKFKGLADFSSEINKFDFVADVKKIDLHKINIIKRDSISILKGKINLDISGNTFDDIVGEANFKDIVYTNPKKSYVFKRFNIVSSLKDSIHTIKIDSKDIIEGKLEGKFTFSELLPITQNALGSVYSNYSPLPVSPNQFINFNFTIHNQIVDIFFPQVSLSPKTIVKGKINSNKNSVKLNFSSPKIDVYKNIIDKIELRLDNKNKLYNTHITADKVTSKYYKVSKLNLLNRTVNDTLFFKSTFKGGEKDTENFNLDFFYTINEDKKSVIGLQKSTFNYKGNNWTINPEDNQNNKLSFDLRDDSFVFSPFKLVSKEQKIEFLGSLKGNKQKDFKTNFTNVELTSFLPDIKNLALNGLVNGNLSILQKGGNIQPTANIVINDVMVNELSQGTLKAKIEGANSYDKYKVDISIKDYDFDNVKVVGTLDFSTKKPTMDILVKLKEYEINGFSNLGEETIENIRGRVSGKFTSKGYLYNPVFKGDLSIVEGGLTIPYLNIDFDFIKNANVKLKGQSFTLKNVVLQDTKYDTHGYLSGNINHENFEKWYLDLDLNTSNLLVLDTKEVDEIPYYGKAFLRGSTQIEGLTSNLTIDVIGKTEKGTNFVIPLSDVTTLNNYKLIHFKKNKEEETDKLKSIKNIGGLNLNLNLEVTKDAVAQVVIDKVTGNELKGSGTGNLLIEIDTKGKFLMNGDLSIDNGEYNFRYSGISKKFEVQKGGTISWSGDPFSAELDLVAIYKAKANPAQLLNSISSSRKIPVDLYTKITGGLFNSEQEFDIKIPNANSMISSELEFVLNDNDSNNKMLNFFSLLFTGSFYNRETLASNAASDFGIGTASDLLSNVLSNVINSKDDKFKLGVGYSQGRTNDVKGVDTDNQLDVSVTSQLNDRVLLNGKVGVPVGAKTQTSVIGEVKLEVLLNEKGTFRWTIFNKPNDIQYSIEEEGYTQGTGLSYQVNFNSFKELGQKIRGKEPEENLHKKDTIVKTKKLINFASRKKDTVK